MERISRREMVEAVMVGAVMGDRSIAAQTQRAAPTTRPALGDARLALIEEAWGEPMDQELRRNVMGRIIARQSAWMNHRAKEKLPQNVEPSFVFRPTEVGRG